MRHHVRHISTVPLRKTVLQRSTRRRYLGLTAHKVLKPPYAVPQSAPPALGFVLAMPICVAFWAAVGFAIHLIG